MASANEVEARLSTHEAVCAERWKETILRIKRIEHILIGSAGAIILMLLGLVTIWDDIQREHNAIVQRRKAAELAAQREKERLEKQKRERALIATVIGTGGIMLYHLVNYIIDHWPSR